MKLAQDGLSQSGGKTVIHKFKKRPSAKNLARRSVSFAAVGEVEHVGPNDLVVIDVVSGQFGNNVTTVTVTGDEFLNGLQEKTAKKSGTKVLIFGF